jgi:hypothetical protein
MPKYYVKTGGSKTIVDAESVKNAGEIGLRRIVTENDFPPLGMLLSVSERGFDDDCEHDDTFYISTTKVLKTIGLAVEYE